MKKCGTCDCWYWGRRYHERDKIPKHWGECRHLKVIDKIKVESPLRPLFHEDFCCVHYQPTWWEESVEEAQERVNNV